MWTLKVIPSDTTIPFMKARLVAFIASGLMILASLFFFFSQGLNFGIDFKGGSVVEVRVIDGATPNLSVMRENLNSLGYGQISIQEFGSPEDLLIRIPAQSGGENVQEELLNNVRNVLGEGVEYRRTEFVGPQVGQELITAGAMAVIFSILGILIYIWIRFEWQFGMAAVLALIHDGLLVVGIFSWLQMEFNLSTVAAVLMIAGYSINDTVVVFDRIRENLRKYKKMPLVELFNISLNQTLSRTILTSGTTLLALGALWYFGGEVIRGFTDALIWGIMIGTYSSVLIAAPLLMLFNLRNIQKKAEETADEDA